MSLWDDCRPWVPQRVRFAPPKPPTKAKARKASCAPAPLPPTPAQLDYRYRKGRTTPLPHPDFKGGKPRSPSNRLTRIEGHNAKLRPCAATIDQIELALERRDLGYRAMATLLGEPVTQGMVRHWRSGNLPRMYLRAKGLVVA